MRQNQCFLKCNRVGLCCRLQRSKFELIAMVIWQIVGMYSNGRDEVVVSLTRFFVCWRMYVLGY